MRTRHRRSLADLALLVALAFCVAWLLEPSSNGAILKSEIAQALEGMKAWSDENLGKVEIRDARLGPIQGPPGSVETVLFQAEVRNGTERKITGLLLRIRLADKSSQKEILDEAVLLPIEVFKNQTLKTANYYDTARYVRIPMKPDSNRSEATLRVCDNGVSGLSQGFHA